MICPFVTFDAADCVPSCTRVYSLQLTPVPYEVISSNVEKLLMWQYQFRAGSVPNRTIASHLDVKNPYAL
jgi:hypothetical protein